ncbi:MAG TPA: holin [Jiangellaceae bacterium]|nr:holin [Jiangellaceae bacterium]
MTKLAFWKAAAERAVKTGAQFVLVGWGVGDGIFNAWNIEPMQAAGLGLGGVIVSLLTSLASLGTGNGPSLTNSETLKG